MTVQLLSYIEFSSFPCASALHSILCNDLISLVHRCLLQLHASRMVLDLYRLTKRFTQCLFSFWNVFSGSCFSLFTLIFLENLGLMFFECFVMRSSATGTIGDDINLLLVSADL